jgi:hypothetical protein
LGGRLGNPRLRKIRDGLDALALPTDDLLNHGSPRLVYGVMLTQNTEGPSMSTPGKLAKLRDVIEIQDKDHRVLTSHMQGEDRKWTQFMTVHFRRKK